MLVLQGNKELEQTFQKVIQTMDARVAWEGRFIIDGNEMILEGKVRSLVFQFETKMVLTDLIDQPVDESKVVDVAKHPKLQDMLNLVLYAFGKWRTLRGLKVEQDYAQLNKLFERVLKPYYIEPSFRKENLRFYKEDVRITYEEALVIVLESEEKPQEGTDEEDQRAQGLWHTLVWEKRQRQFRKEETSLQERQDERLGNNFYLVGYQCADCSQKMHMAVYPPGMEMRIDTQEKGVFMARVYTCSQCHSFCTPRPGRLLAEGDVYEMHFGSDEKAYQDYLELLGKNADRTANFKYNEYEALRGKMGQEKEPDIGEFSNADEALRQLESYGRGLDGLSDGTFKRLIYRIEDGFFPDMAVAKHEKKIKEQEKKRGLMQTQENGHGKPKGAAESDRNGKNKDASDGAFGNQKGKNAKSAFNQNPTDRDILNRKAKNEKNAFDPGINPDRNTNRNPDKNSDLNIAKRQAYPVDRADSDMPGKSRKNASSGSHTKSERFEKYEARFGVWERLSDRQKSDLKRQIQMDSGLSEQEKSALLRPLEEARQKERVDAARKKMEGLELRNYKQIKKALLELAQEDIPESLRQSFADQMQRMLKQRANEEAQKIIENMPERFFDRSGYSKLERKLEEYKEADLSPYEGILRQKREEAEKGEIAGIVKRARKKSRADFVGLMQRLEGQGFTDNLITPYMEKIKEKLREMDEKRLEEISDRVQYMDFGEAADAYEKIAQGDFLPELKDNALEMLTRRLQKIRTDECELLVQKLKEEMRGKIRENPRHHFYPARKVMLKTADVKETAAIDAALHSYAGSREMFEYPIFTVDTSRGHNGRDGMLLTPDTLFYSARMNSYAIPVGSIAGITASTGLLNKKITLEEANGALHKLPYAVGTAEMESWAQVLEGFIGYLKQKPASRKLKYLAKETHDTICCFRCGHIYRGSDVCPECGYKQNR